MVILDKLNQDELASKIMRSAHDNHPEYYVEVFSLFYALARLGEPIIECAKKACGKIRSNRTYSTDYLKQRALQKMFYQHR